MPAEAERRMAEAVELAWRGEGLTRPNPPVGAVVVRGGRVVGRGFHARAGGLHAEAAALREAGRRARGAELYVTLEPCSTRGRQPPCTDAVKACGVRRVWVGVSDPNPRHAGRGLRILRGAGIDVVTGVLKPACAALVRPFARWVADGRPYVTLKLAMTLDGRIADAEGCSRWITGAAARRAVHDLRRRADAVLVGARTVAADDPSLRPRPAHGRRPLRVVADGRGRTPVSARVLNDRWAADTVFAVTEACPPARRRAYERRGARVRVCGGPDGRVDLAALARELGGLGVLHLVCEGGGELAASLIGAGLVDAYALFYAPAILGGRGARPGVAGADRALADRVNLRVREVVRVGDDWLVRAEPRRRPRAGGRGV